MGAHGIDVGAVEQVFVGARIVLLDPVDQLELPHHPRLAGLRRLLDLLRHYNRRARHRDPGPGLVLHPRQIDRRARHQQPQTSPAKPGKSAFAVTRISWRSPCATSRGHLQNPATESPLVGKLSVMRKNKRFKRLRCLTEKLPPLSFFAHFAECLTLYRLLDHPRRSGRDNRQRLDRVDDRTAAPLPAAPASLSTTTTGQSGDERPNAGKSTLRRERGRRPDQSLPKKCLTYTTKEHSSER